MFGLRAKRKRNPSAPGPATRRGAKDAINAKRDRESARSRLKSASSREIGPLPDVVDIDRLEACRFDLERFCQGYSPAIFYLPFCPAQKKAIAKLQHAVLHGGSFALAMPRGSGKTMLCLVAAIWALVYGHRRFLCMIAANVEMAKALLTKIKAQLRTNDTLAADFPHVCHPIRCLEDDGRRANGQILNGIKTFITWGKTQIVFPTVAGSACSGAIVTAVGLSGGSIRGQIHMTESGEAVRPDMAFLDDPQTRTSAWSDPQCQTRLGIFQGDVMGLSGPGKKIAAAIACTVIRHGDMADQLLNRKLHPELQGERIPMVESFPSNEKLWEQYGQIRADSFERDPDGREATDFYRQHRAEMDEGAKVYWPERFDEDEISAVQHAMNFKLRNEEAFAAEAQNEPKEQKTQAIDLKPEDIVTKLSGYPRGLVPTKAQKLTAFVDVHDELLYYAVCAWGLDDFDGWVIDYGTYPEQAKRYFTLRQAAPSLTTVFPGLTKEAAIRAGLEKLTEKLCREYIREDGAVMSLDRLLIDRGYLPEVVQNFIRTSGKGSLIMPARGKGITAANKPMSDYERRPGEVLGHNWMIPKPANQELRHILHDTNCWKGFVHKRLSLPAGTKGALLLYGKKTQEHRMIADHIVGEYGTPTEGQGRRLVEYRKRPTNPDVHLLDCVTGCTVAASTCGCGKSTGAVTHQQPKRRPSYRKAVYLNDNA